MLKKVKEKIDILLQANKGSINQSDYELLKAYIDLLYNCARKKYIKKEI